jgi:hypothetical protein
LFVDITEMGGLDGKNESLSEIRDNCDERRHQENRHQNGTKDSTNKTHRLWFVASKDEEKFVDTLSKFE